MSTSVINFEKEGNKLFFVLKLSGFLFAILQFIISQSLVLFCLNLLLLFILVISSVFTRKLEPRKQLVMLLVVYFSIGFLSALPDSKIAQGPSILFTLPLSLFLASQVILFMLFNNKVSSKQFVLSIMQYSFVLFLYFIVFGHPFLMDSYSFVKKIQLKTIAHRGGTAFGPESTSYTIRKTCQLTKPFGIEIDIRESSDNNLIVIHDENLFRYSNGERNSKINQLTLSQLKEFNFGQYYLTKHEQLSQNDSYNLSSIRFQEPHELFDTILDVCENDNGFPIIILDWKGKQSYSQLNDLLGNYTDRLSIQIRVESYDQLLQVSKLDLVFNGVVKLQTTPRLSKRINNNNFALSIPFVISSQLFFNKEAYYWTTGSKFSTQIAAFMNVQFMLADDTTNLLISSWIGGGIFWVEISVLLLCLVVVKIYQFNYRKANRLLTESQVSFLQMV